jgi:hypothetical protein
LEKFNGELSACRAEDLRGGEYAKKEQISELFKAEKEQLIPLPREFFGVFELEKVKTDKYNFIYFDSNGYSISAGYSQRETRLETGTFELRLLNKKYGRTAVQTKEIRRRNSAGHAVRRAGFS